MPEQFDDAREIDRFWNDLVAGRGDVQGYAISPDTLETVRAFLAMAKTPPAPSSRERVDRDVFAPIDRASSKGRPSPPTAKHRVIAHPDDVFGRNGSHDPGDRQAAPDRKQSGWSLAVAVPLVAALILLALVGSRIALSPSWPIARQEKPAFLAAATAMSATSVPVPGPVAEPLWQADGKPNAALRLPAGVTVDPQGNLWVTDGVKGRFVIFSPEGIVLETWGERGSGEGQFDFKCGSEGYGGVAFDRTGIIYVADAGNQRIQKFSPDRTFVTSWPSRGIVDSQFLSTGRGNQAAGSEVASCPVDIATGQDGRLYVSDRDAHVIGIFDADGRPLDDATTAPMSPEQLTLDSDGNIWVADNTNRVLKFSADGNLLRVWENLELEGEQWRFMVPMAIAVDEQGRVFVADQSDRIQVFSPEGTLLTAWGSSGGAAGELFDAAGLVLDGQGHIYVVEHYGNRVQKFRLLPPFTPE
jgi:DNA-binding beta-propeller fold protein YncE